MITESVWESYSEEEWIITWTAVWPLPQAYIKEGHGELINHNHFRVIRMDQRGSQLMQNPWHCLPGHKDPNLLCGRSKLLDWPQLRRGHPVGFLWAQEIRTPRWGCSIDSQKDNPAEALASRRGRRGCGGTWLVHTVHSTGLYKQNTTWWEKKKRK